MAKFFLILLITALIVYFLGQFLPFWALMILIAGLSFFVGGNSGTSFLGGGIAFGGVWLVMVLMISIQTNSGLPDKMAALMGLTNPQLLWLVTTILGFLLGGFSALTGNLFKKTIHSKRLEKRPRY
ncbi:hypothetical protein [Rhodonellum sp.]|uniref:hypothetical protein n=1 Tax=Rhodonellum sp. TaxID=2231180 RepID=UPI0027278364|nr:hypothetical protein [Rhodonellum sp.]MDO9551425.1 hypothetical protein [Rhodonellum sp.]